MKSVLSVTAVAFALLGATTQAHALTKTQSQTRGNQASFSSGMSTPCGYESVSVWAFEQDQRGQTVASNAVYVDYYSYDFCAGVDTWGYSLIDSSSYNQQRVSSASVTAIGTMELTSCTYSSGGGADGGVVDADGGVGSSYACQSASVPLAVDLDFVGVGDSYKDRSNYSYSTPHARYRSRYTSQSREASVQGLVSVDNHDVDVSSGYGSLAMSSSGYFEMSR